MSTKEDIVNALTEVAKMHHDAFKHVDGADPEWPKWYAERLVIIFESIDVKKTDVDQLASNLTILDQKYRTEEPETDWKEYYADHLANL